MGMGFPEGSCLEMKGWVRLSAMHERGRELAITPALGVRMTRTTRHIARATANHQTSRHSASVSWLSLNRHE